MKILRQPKYYLEKVESNRVRQGDTVSPKLFTTV